MSGGSGGMPFGQNMGIGQGQQMQNPQMGQPGGGFMGGQRMGQMPQGGMFGQGGTSMMTNPNMGGQIAPMQVGQQVGGGMGSMPRFANQQGYDDFMARGGMQGVQDRMAGIGGLFFGNGNGGGMNYTGGSRDFDETGGGGFNRYPPQIDPNTGYPVGAVVSKPIGPGDGPFGYGGNRPGTQGPGDGLAPRGPYPINDGNVMPPGAGYPPPTNTTMPLPRRRPDNVLVSKPPGDLPGRGMPPGYGPTKGPIDGRKLRDMMDITKRRQMDFDLKNRGGGGLPGSARDGIPPSLNRPSRLTK